MSLRRRELLLGALSGSLLAAHPAASEKAPVRVALVTGDEKQAPDIGLVFADLGLETELFTLTEAEAIDSSRFALLWLTCPSYPFVTRFSAAMLGKIEGALASGAGVFSEFAFNFPGVPAGDALWKTGVARLFVSRPLDIPGTGLPAGTILEEHDSICLPLKADLPELRQVLSFGKVRGVERVIDPPATGETWPGLVLGNLGKGRFAVAATSLSAFRTREYAPTAHWERFLRELALALLPEPERTRVISAYIPCRAYTEPRAWAMPGERYRVVVESRLGARVELADGAAATETVPGRYEIPMAAGRTKDVTLRGSITAGNSRRPFEVRLRLAGRREAYTRALERNIRWFERSGVMPRPDGSLGVAEWISGPDMDGNRIPYGKGQMFSPERADCVFESAVAMWLYGKVVSSPRHAEIGRNMMRRIMDFQRLERGDRFYGLWYTRGRSGPVYQDDTAIAIVFSLAGHRLMGHPMYLERGLMAAKASLAVFGGEVPQAAGAADPGRDHPHDRGQMIAAWLYTYGITGDRSYLEKALPVLRRMIEEYPRTPRYLISHTGEAARFLLPLALAFHYTKDDTFAGALSAQADYLRSRTVPCGAIQEDGSNTGNRLSGTDLGLTYDRGEAIADQLYTTSFAAMNYWIAYKATGDTRYLEDYFRVTDFLVRIQVQSANPAIDGGWMRGFDYSLWEYYGSNADQSWTAYCLETGWTNAIIDIALALHLLDESFYKPRPAAF